MVGDLVNLDGSCPLRDTIKKVLTSDEQPQPLFNDDEPLQIIDKVVVKRSITSLHIFAGATKGPLAEMADELSDELVQELGDLE